MATPLHDGFQRGFLLGKEASKPKQQAEKTKRRQPLDAKQQPNDNPAAAVPTKAKRDLTKTKPHNSGFAKGFLNSSGKQSKPKASKKKSTSGFAKGFLNTSQTTTATTKINTTAEHLSSSDKREKKQSNPGGSGFAKGFLNSKKKPETENAKRHNVQANDTGSDATLVHPERTSGKTKSSPVCSDLLAFEESERLPTNGRNKDKTPLELGDPDTNDASQKSLQNSPLISILPTSERNQTPSKKALISVIDDDERESDQVIESDSGNIVEVPEFENDDESLVHQAGTPHVKEQVDEPLWKEVTTTRKEPSFLITPFDTVTASRGSPPPDPEQPPIVETVVDVESAAATAREKEVVTYAQVQKDLESLAWRSQRNKEILKSANGWNAEKLKWAWQWILGANGKLSSDHKRLIDTILFNHPTVIAPFLVKETQADRTVALQCVCLVQESLAGTNDDDNNKIDHKAMLDWMVTLDALLGLIEQPRRTVLAQHGSDAALYIVAYIAQAFLLHAEKQEDSESKLFPNLTLQLDRILELQLSWKRPKARTKKNRAMIAILEDWLRINQACRSGKLPATIWCKSILGIEFKDHETLGCLVDTLCNSTPASIADIEDAISCCGESNSPDDNSYELAIRSWFRGILGAVSTCKIPPSRLQEPVGQALNVLSKCRAQDSRMLVWAFLDFVWSDSEGLPADIATSSSNPGTSPRIPQSIDAMLDTLAACAEDQSHPESSDPTYQAISHLVARCIIAHEDSCNVTRAVVSRLGMSVCTIQILLTLLSHVDAKRGDSERSPENCNDDKAPGDDALEDDFMPYVADVLIDNIPKSSYLRGWLRTRSFNGLSAVPVASVVPKLLRQLTSIGENGKKSDDVRSTIQMALTSILRTNVALCRINDLVLEMTSSLENISEESKSNGSDCVGKTCSNFGGSWRRELLSNPTLGTEAFGDVLVSVADVMFSSPSSLVPLALLGGIVGVDLDATLVKPRERAVILSAITRLLGFCNTNLKKSSPLVTEAIIFGRLSPLLLLRRLPVAYFEIARSESCSADSKELLSALESLASELALRLDIDQSPAAIVEVSAEERRLAAEVAGRCLSFGIAGIDRDGPNLLSETCTSYGRLCHPAFSALLRSIGSPASTISISAIRSARAALYAVCIHIPFARGDEAVSFFHDAYSLTSQFALEVVGYETDALGPEVAVEFLQLQRGCIQFFSSCVERSILLHITKKASSSNSIVVDSAVVDEHGRSSPAHTSKGALGRVCQALTAIVRNSEASEPLIRSGEDFYGIQEAPSNYSVPARVCIWNGFIIAAQSLPSEDGSLAFLARSTLPWVVEWGSASGTAGDEHHPLCVAAALQLAFILLTRLQTLEYFAQGRMSLKLAVSRTHNWALAAVKDPFRTADCEVGNQTRLAGLKLLLAIITIDSKNSDEMALPCYLTPSEVGGTFAFIQGIANMDPDPAVRELATRIMGYQL